MNLLDSQALAIRDVALTPGRAIACQSDASGPITAANAPFLLSV